LHLQATFDPRLPKSTKSISAGEPLMKKIFARRTLKDFFKRGKLTWTLGAGNKVLKKYYCS